MGIKWLDITALVITIIGAINWRPIGLFELDLWHSVSEICPGFHVSSMWLWVCADCIWFPFRKTEK